MSFLRSAQDNPVYCLQIEAEPLPNHPDAATLGGAFVNCWVVANAESEAVATAHKNIASQLWRIGQPVECYKDDRSFYGSLADGLQYYEQALIDGEVYVFFTYPLNDQSELH